MKLHLYANPLKSQAHDIRAKLSAEAEKLGFRLSDDGSAADVIIALGGDGTILRAVHAFPGVPVFGLNLGGLGYLSCVGDGEWEKVLASLADGRYRISERSMLEVRGATSDAPAYALNDIVIVREMTGHAAIFDLTVDGCAATRYLADGLVLATPTGSTAYSLSAGGPVLLPDSRSFVITPMNPHALGIRPIVVSDRSVFSITPQKRSGGEESKIAVYADGETVRMLPLGESVTITRAARSALLVELDGYDPYEVLARKLGWSGTSV